MSLREILLASSRRPILGRPLRSRTARPRARRDATRHTSDTVWALVERMMQGDTDAARVLDDVIEEGVSSGKTRFVKVTRRAGRLYGKPYPEEVVPNHYAAVTPGRQIVLFGLRKVYEQGAVGGVLRGYVRRFAVGDTAEYDSYNLVYLGTITSITEKRVTIDKGRGYSRKAVLDIATFDSKNHDLDVEEAVRKNREWTD